MQGQVGHVKDIGLDLEGNGRPLMNFRQLCVCVSHIWNLSKISWTPVRRIDGRMQGKMKEAQLGSFYTS